MITSRVLNNLKRKFRLMSNEYRIKTAQDLTNIAVKVRRKEMKAMVQQLDRPTPFTQRSVLFRAAHPRTLTSIVYIRPIQAKYLIHQIKGGVITASKPIPTNTSENKYGNLPRNASRRKKVFAIRSRRTGKRYMVQRKGKSRTVLLATWSTRRTYRRGLYDFYGVASRVVRQEVRRIGNR